MKKRTTVTPHSGFYLVTMQGRWGNEIQSVSTEDCCSCGGNAEWTCRHIKAVNRYLHDSGDPARTEPYLNNVGALNGQRRQTRKEGVRLHFNGDKKNLYDLARDAVAARATGFPEESLTIFQTSKLRVNLSRFSHLLMMTAVNGDPAQAERVRIGFLSVYRGWVFDLSQSDYRQWAARAKQLVGTRGE